MATKTKPPPAAPSANGTHVRAPAPDPAEVVPGDEDGWRLIPLAKIHPSPLNPRKHFDQAKIEDLAKSIRAKGVLQPILVRPAERFTVEREDADRDDPDVGGDAAPKSTWHIVDTRAEKLRDRYCDEYDDEPAAVAAAARYNAEAGAGGYELADGERRYLAAGLAGLKVIPAIVRRLSDRDLLEIAVITGDQREDITALEKAGGYARLIEMGATREELAAKLGRSVSTVRGLLSLLQLPEPARKALESGRLPPQTAGLIARVPGEKARDAAARFVLGGDDCNWYCDDPPDDRALADLEKREGAPLSYREAKDLIEQKFTVELKSAKFDRRALDLVPGVGGCAECPQRAGNLQKADPDGYAGVRADVCTNPDCFRGKTEAWQRGVLADAEAKGQAVLAEKEAAKLFPHGGSLAYDAPYLDLAEACYEHKKRATYDALLAKHLEPKDVVLAFDRHGELHRLVAKDAALPILRKEHGLAKGEGTSLSAKSDRTGDEQRREDAKRRAEQKLRREATREQLGELAAKAEALFSCLLSAPGLGFQIKAVLRNLVNGAVGYGSTRDEIFARRDCRGKTSTERTATLHAHADTLDAAGLMALLVELQLGPSVLGWGCDRELSKTLGLRTRKQVEKEVRERLKAEKAAKKAGK